MRLQIKTRRSTAAVSRPRLLVVLDVSDSEDTGDLNGSDCHQRDPSHLHLFRYSNSRAALINLLRRARFFAQTMGEPELNADFKKKAQQRSVCQVFVEVSTFYPFHLQLLSVKDHIKGRHVLHEDQEVSPLSQRRRKTIMGFCFVFSSSFSSLDRSHVVSDNCCVIGRNTVWAW